ncbi:hypothetical protein AX14_005601 [Amanita brunnescens Koide BX004]|nr:hypothetical protein AX14_005601 [Amanita brunnescens Koide BX004]
MGLLKQGTVLTWEETKEQAKRIKQLGVEQFLQLWESEANRQDDERKWGDEIEYMLVHFDNENKNATLAACQDETLEKLNSHLADLSPGSCPNQPAFVTEFAKYQIETSPGAPYTSAFADLLLVESNMRQRREMIRQQLGPNEAPITLSNFPRLGAPGIFTYPPLSVVENGIEGSLTIPEKLTGSHRRYETINANMIAKRGSKILAYVPIFVDDRTDSPFYDPVHQNSFENGQTHCEGRIFFDSTLFGAGCCCMQVTQQLRSLDQARKIYDALLPLTPLLMALSASSPAWRGYLSDTDCRWNVASRCLDERTQEEHQAQIRPRWDISGMYLSCAKENKPEYNDLLIAYDDHAYKTLREHGVDELLSKHIASLFSREPLIAYDDDFDVAGKSSMMNHFDNLASSVWQALRLKPPQGPQTGWRVEFRTIEASITDFESAAYAIFLVLFSGAVLHFHLNLYIPMSKARVQVPLAAVVTEKFTFRTQFHGNLQLDHRSASTTTEYEEMTIDEIFNGSKSNFPGLLTFVEKYVELQSPDEETRVKLFKYIDFIRGKAQGLLLCKSPSRV